MNTVAAHKTIGAIHIIDEEHPRDHPEHGPADDGNSWVSVSYPNPHNPSSPILVLVEIPDEMINTITNLARDQVVSEF